MKLRWSSALALLLTVGAGTLSSCSIPSVFAPLLLYDVSVSPAIIRPNGSGMADQAKIHYALGTRANVTLTIVEPNGTTHLLRDGVLRAPDQYDTRFDGSISTGEGPNRRVLPDGAYQIKVRAEQPGGKQAEQTLSLTIQDADVSPLEVSNVIILPTTITPNGDGKDDEAAMSYSLSKKAEVTVFATNADGNFALILPPTEQQGEAGLPVPWDGKENGGRLLPNGNYTVHVQAIDKAGNVSEAVQSMTIDNGGTPQMAITKVKFWPPVVPISGTLRVDITVKNIGNTLIQTLGPDPGTAYTLNSSYATFRNSSGTPLYYERIGYWRVGVMWSAAPQPYPIRWGFGKDLKPGDEVTVSGTITVDAELSRTGTFFWAGIEQGGVGFLDTNKGQTEIRFSY